MQYDSLTVCAYAILSVCQYTNKPICQYANILLGRYATMLFHIGVSVCQSVSMPICQYAYYFAWISYFVLNLLSGLLNGFPKTYHTLGSETLSHAPHSGPPAPHRAPRK